MIKKNLIAIATYNESDNIINLIQDIIKYTNNKFDILIVDDNSPDGTASIIKKIKAKNINIHLIRRKGKFGLGSAHKRIFQYTIINKYTKLITLDADFSHSPKSINRLLEASNDENFVIGSRYVPGSSCDYTGYRKYVSLLGNYVARKLLRIPSKEVTTSFRVFSKKILESIDISMISSDGYAFMVEVIHIINIKSFKIIEIPIHFYDRKNNISKIPKLQIIYSIINLFKLWLFTKIEKTVTKINTSNCRGCNAVGLIPLNKYKKSKYKPFKYKSSDFACSSISSTKIQPSLHKCLDCNLIQIPKNESINNLNTFYRDVIDKAYIDNLDIKYKTFKKVFKTIKPYINKIKQDKKDFQILDIGSYYGAFLKVLELNHIKAIGIEPSNHAYKFSIKNCSYKVENTTLEEYTKQQNKRYYLITSFDVIEHVEDVGFFLEEINSLLKDDGIFIFSTIFIDSLFAKILGKYWPWIIPMHLSYFNKNSIQTFLKDHKFVKIGEFKHKHYARITYALRGLSNKMPSSIKKIINFFELLLPNNLIAPFSFGDVKIIVAKKIT